MAKSTIKHSSLNYLATTAWILLFPLAVGCSVQPATKNLTDGAKAPALQQEDQAVTKSEPSGPSGSMSLLMPSGMPASIDQVRLSMARKTPLLESLYMQKQDVDAKLVAEEERLKQLELTQGNNLSNIICWKDSVGGGGCSEDPYVGKLIGLHSGSGNVFTIDAAARSRYIAAQKDRIKAYRIEASAHFDAEVAAASKTEPKGQQLFQLGAGIPQLQLFDLLPGQYFLLVEVLDSTTGKVYQKGRSMVEIVAGQVAEANIKLVPVSQPEGGLIVTLGGSGFTKSGESKICPTPTPATVCPMVHVMLTESDALWQHACQAQGHQLVSCIRNRCESPTPSEGTQLCSGVVK